MLFNVSVDTFEIAEEMQDLQAPEGLTVIEGLPERMPAVERLRPLTRKNGYGQTVVAESEPAFLARVRAVGESEEFFSRTSFGRGHGPDDFFWDRDDAEADDFGFDEDKIVNRRDGRPRELWLGGGSR